MRLLICALLMALGSSALLAQESGLKVEGTLTDDDPKDKVLRQSPHKVHEYKLKAGKVYVIDLSSKDFDCVLRLEDPAGKQVALNDDAAPGTLNSRIVYKAASPGMYKIIATCLDKKTGSYLLTVRRGTEEDIAKADPFYAIIGKAAPEISGVFALNGDTKKLSELKGKVVLIDFWAVWCGPCIATFPHLREWTKEFSQDDFAVLGVTTYFERFAFDKKAGRLTQATTVKKEEDKEIMVPRRLSQSEEHGMLKEFAAHHQLTHRLLAVSKENWGKASKDYRIQGIPEAVLIDRKGIVRMVRVGSGPANASELHAEIKKLIAEK